MPPKKGKTNKKETSKDKLKKQRERLAKMKSDREKKMEKIMQDMEKARQRAKQDLKKFRKMELRLEVDKKTKKNKKFSDLKVASQIASALNKKDKDEDNFAEDAIALLQEIKQDEPEPEEVGISMGKLKSALRSAKAKPRKKDKDLLMKGKLKIWGDTPPNGLKLDSLLRRHTRGGGTTSPIPGLKEYIDSISPPPPIADRFVALRQHYLQEFKIFIALLFKGIWANKKRNLFNKLKKKAGTNDKTVSSLMHHEYSTAVRMMIQQWDILLDDFKISVQRDPPHKQYFFRQTTLIDSFDTEENRDYIGRLLDELPNNHTLFFLYVLKFFQIVVGKNRSDTKLNKDGDYEIDPIDNFVLLATIISYYRVFRILQRRDVPQVYNDLCNTILQIHKKDLINKRFIGWQKGGRKKTRKRRKKRKNRKKTRK